MESNAGLNRLLELIFGKKPTIPKEMVTHSSISSSLLTEDFSTKLARVFKVKKRIASLRWPKYFDSHCRKMLSSNMMYLMHVINACFLQHERIQNVFESFISVCALVMHLSEETLEKTGMDFRDLNPDIIMIFYQIVLKSSFLGQGGIDPFVEYICGHKYLTWWNKNDLALSDEPTSSVLLEPDLNEKILKELNRYPPIQGAPDDGNSAIKKTTVSLMVVVVRENTSFKFPTLPSESDLIKRLVAYRKKEIAKKSEGKEGVEAALTNVTSHGNSSSNSDSKTDYFAEQREDIDIYENVVQAVSKHNHSDHFRCESANRQIEEAEGILDHLKNGINSLIEVLDECENE